MRKFLLATPFSIFNEKIMNYKIDSLGELNKIILNISQKL